MSNEMQRLFSLISVLLLTTLLALVVFKLEVEQVKSDLAINTEEVENQDHQDEESEEIQFQLKELFPKEMDGLSMYGRDETGFNYHFAIISYAQSIHSPPPEV